MCKLIDFDIIMATYKVPWKTAHLNNYLVTQVPMYVFFKQHIILV